MLRKGILNLPNLLTAFRIFLVPLVVVVLLTEFQFEKWLFLSREALAVGLFLVASLTDLLDGYLARRRGEVTTLGQLLDPIADKLLVSSVLISLVEMQLIPAWVVVVIVGREFSVTGLRLIAAVNQVVIPAGRLGKWKMVVEVIAICFIIWGNQKEWDWVLLTGRWLLYLVAAVALVSMAEYFVQFSRRIDLFTGGKGT
jgi:CDP-diacylglycerol--glycerol-3-phosphate 3-phosphatidyltransferase